MRLDEVELTKQLSGTRVNGVNVNDKDSADDTTVRGAGAPPPEVELRIFFLSILQCVWPGFVLDKNNTNTFLSRRFGMYFFWSVDYSIIGKWF